MKDYIKALVNYGVAHDLIQEADSRYVYNRLLDVMHLERGGGTAPKGEPLTAILTALTDDAVHNMHVALYRASQDDSKLAALLEMVDARSVTPELDRFSLSE